MYYIFNSKEEIRSWCNFEPCKEDLDTRGEFAILSESVFENPLNVVVGKYRTLFDPVVIVSDEYIASQLLEDRNKILSLTDWISSRHLEQKTLGIKTSISEEQFNEYLNYRQSLRDITKLDKFPHVALPDKPQFME